MKISASIYSSKQKDLARIVKDLDDHGADFFHIDCNDDPSVFEDIAHIRQLSQTPIDLHIITPTPSRYYDLLTRHQVDFVCFQYEELQEELHIPDDLNSKVGLAITLQTDNSVFEPYADKFDFVLMMATTPGKSGGTFDKSNFKKIRQFRQKFPHIRIHVDGGVNHEVSFILRNIGVYASVSGSYLMNSESIGAAMLNLKTHDIASHYQVKDFMREVDETPTLSPSQRSIREILSSIEDANLGFTLLVDDNGVLEGMVTNADVRKGLLKHIDNLNEIEINDLVNPDPVAAQEDFTVEELLDFIREQTFPINYLPVINHERKVTGSVAFMNLIKGEL